MSIVSDLADAIDRQEGPDKNNNPGNIWDGLDPPRKTKRIWPHLPIDSRGFVIYPTAAAGRAALEHDLTVKINRGMDLRELMTMYAPPSENDTETYIRNVSAWTGIPSDVPLNRLESLPGEPEPGAGEVVAYTVPPEASISDVFGTQEPQTTQAGLLGQELTPTAIAALIVAGLVLYFYFED